LKVLALVLALALARRSSPHWRPLKVLLLLLLLLLCPPQWMVRSSGCRRGVKVLVSVQPRHQVVDKDLETHDEVVKVLQTVLRKGRFLGVGQRLKDLGQVLDDHLHAKKMVHHGTRRARRSRCGHGCSKGPKEGRGSKGPKGPKARNAE